MVWITSKVNGNVLEVADPDLAAQLEADGHAVFDRDPRDTVEPKRKPGRPPKTEK